MKRKKRKSNKFWKKKWRNKKTEDKVRIGASDERDYN